MLNMSVRFWLTKDASASCCPLLTQTKACDHLKHIYTFIEQPSIRPSEEIWLPDSGQVHIHRALTLQHCSWSIHRHGWALLHPLALMLTSSATIAPILLRAKNDKLPFVFQRVLCRLFHVACEVQKPPTWW